MKNIALATLVATSLLTLSESHAQTSYTSTAVTTAWNASRWNNSADIAPYTSSYISNNAVSFTAGNYSFDSLINSIDVGNITLASGVNVTMSFVGGATFGAGGNVRTLSVGAGSTLDFVATAFSTAPGTGYIKSGAGVLALRGSAYTGGFTLNAGTVLLRDTLAMGKGMGNVLTLNGGVLAPNAATGLDSSYYPGGIVIGGNVQLGALASVVPGATNGGTLNFANNVSLGAATRTLTLGNNGNMTLGGVISGNAGSGLNVSRNAGTSGNALILGGINTYTGITTVKDGAEIQFSGTGSIAASSGLVIGNTAGTEFDVNGTQPNPYTLPANVTFTIGTTTGSNGLFNSSGRNVAFNNTTLTLDMLGVLAQGSYAFNLFDTLGNAGSIGSFQLTGAYSGTFAALSNTTVGNGTFTYAPATGILNVEAIPEPSTWAIFLAGVVALAFLRSNKTQFGAKTTRHF